MASEGECLPCEDVDSIPVLITVFLLAACTVPTYFYVKADLAKQRITSITSFLILGQFAWSLQTFGVFAELDIMFEEPIASVLSILNIFTFDLDVIKIQCVFNKDDPVVNFAVTLLLLPMAMLIVSCAFAWLRIRGNPNMTFDQYLNLVGLISLIGNVSITMAVVRPLHCLKNPNGSSAMASNPAVICWDSEQHTWLLVLGILGLLLYPISFLAVIAHVTWRYPHLVASGFGLRLLARYRFVFQRFTQACYFWGLCFILRSLLISIIPVVLADLGTCQVISIDVVLTLGLGATASFRPWRTAVANHSELMTMTMLAIFILIAAFFIETNDEEQQALASVLAFIVIGIAVVATSLVGRSVLLRWLARQFYDIFLCHHKEAAGSLARFIKTNIEDYLGVSVFLDSDELDSIESIFDIVGRCTGNLVVLLTKMVLTRVWCAGEITTAKVNNIPIVPVACNDYENRGEQMLTRLDEFWSEEEKHFLLQFGVSLARIKEAYRHFISLEATNLDRFSGVDRQPSRLWVSAVVFG